MATLLSPLWSPSCIQETPLRDYWASPGTQNLVLAWSAACGQFEGHHIEAVFLIDYAELPSLMVLLLPSCDGWLELHAYQQTFHSVDSTFTGIRMFCIPVHRLSDSPSLFLSFSVYIPRVLLSVTCTCPVTFSVHVSSTYFVYYFVFRVHPYLFFFI